MKIGLCLSGGGIKGAAHIGVIKALEEENIKIDCISGTSSGSIIAAMYAMGYNSKDILRLFKDYGKEISKINWYLIFKMIFGLIFRRRLCIDGLNNGNKLSEIINAQAKKKNIRLISDINMPLIIPSVNLYDGSIYMFSSINNNRKYSDEINFLNNIDVGKAVQASCAYPGIFCPVDIANQKMIDGGIRENTPWKELKNIGADKIISVVFEEEKKPKKKINILDCITGSIGIMLHELYNYEVKENEFLLKVKSKDIWLLEVSKTQELYNIGYQTAKEEINKIKEYLQK
jgi:NTE family protein